MRRLRDSPISSLTPVIAEAHPAERRPVRVALLNPCFWPEVRRGSERFIADLGAGLVQRGDRPTLIASRPGRPRRGEFAGMPVKLNWRPPEPGAGYVLNQGYVSHVPLSYASLRVGAFDLAHALHPTDAQAAIRWSRQTGRPSVMSLMGMPPPGDAPRARFGRPAITRRAIAASSVTVALSRAAAAAVERWSGTVPRVISPGTDLSVFTPGGVRAAEPTVFCAAAAGDFRKRIDLVVEALAVVRRSVPTAQLVLSRPREPSVMRAIGDVPGLRWADVDDVARLRDAYAHAWVSVLASRQEAFGLVLVESLACGTPAVGTDDGAIPEILDDDAVGRLFEPDHAGSLAARLLEGFELAAKPGTAAACRRHAERFAVARCVNAYDDLYRELLGW